MRWLALALVLVAVPKSAHAFCRSTTNTSFVPTEAKPCDDAGKPLFWASRCVEVRVHRAASKQVDLETARNLTATAVNVWSNALCDPCGKPGSPSLVVREAGPTDCSFGYLRDAPNTNVVIFRDSDWTHDLGMIALTTVSFRKDTGEIVDADIEIDSDAYHQKLSTGAANPDAYDLESVLVHEAGHLMGLAHSPVAEATMRARYDKGETSLRDLDKDDVCGICAIAPPGRDAPCNGTSSATCSNTETPATPPGSTPPSDDNGGCAVGRASPSTAVFLLLAIAASRLRSRNARR
jgi:hypothetical protein